MYNIEFYFYNFTCYLEHSVRNPLRLFRECGCEFLVYIGYFTCAVSLFFFLTICEYVLLILWLVYFILFWGLSQRCVTQSHAKKEKKTQRTTEKENPMKQIDVCLEASKRNVVRAILFSICWSLLIVLIYCVCIYHDRCLGDRFSAFCSPVHGYPLVVFVPPCIKHVTECDWSRSRRVGIINRRWT